MELGLHNKIALITGAAGDIGRAVSRAFAAEGVRLALIDRDETLLLTTARELRDGGAAVSMAVADLSNPGETIAGVEKVLAPYSGRVDVLVNNAGICPAFPIEHLLDPGSLPDWKAVYDVNFYGYLLSIMGVLPAMQKRGAGVIINNASDLARQPVPEMLHYSTAKDAVVHITQGLAPFLGQFGIRIVAVAPGPTRTAIWTKPGGLMDFYEQKYGKPREESIQLELRNRGMAIPRLAEPEEVASLMLWLASPKASSVTRCVVDINGGSHQSL